MLRFTPQEQQILGLNQKEQKDVRLRLYWQNGPNFRSGCLQGEPESPELTLEWSYSGPVIDYRDEFFAAEGNRLYWRANVHYISGLLEGADVNRTLSPIRDFHGFTGEERLFAAWGDRLYWQMSMGQFASGLVGPDGKLCVDMTYYGDRLDAHDRLFAVNTLENKLYWQARTHYLSGRLTGDGVNKSLSPDTIHLWPDPEARLFAVLGSALFWQKGNRVEVGWFLDDGTLDVRLGYSGDRIGDGDRLFAAAHWVDPY